MIEAFVKVTKSKKDAPIGIIAGGGVLPLRLTEALEGAGQAHILIALNGIASDETCTRAQHSLGIGAVGKMIDLFNSHAVQDYIMIGPVVRPSLEHLELDAIGQELIEKFFAQGGGGDDALLRLITERFQEAGLTALAPENILEDFAAPRGLLSQASADPWKADIEIGQSLLSSLSPFDVGQGCVVQNGQVIAIEGPEGTDAMLLRVADILSSRGAHAASGVFVKLPKIGQERRVDLPTVGLTTLEGLQKAGLAGLVYQGGGTLLIDRDACVDFADRHALFLLGV